MCDTKPFFLFKLYVLFCVLIMQKIKWVKWRIKYEKLTSTMGQYTRWMLTTMNSNFFNNKKYLRTITLQFFQFETLLFCFLSEFDSPILTKSVQVLREFLAKSREKKIVLNKKKNLISISNFIVKKCNRSRCGVWLII